MASSALPLGGSTPAIMAMTPVQSSVPLQATISIAEENGEVSADAALSNSFCLSDYVPDDCGDSQIITPVATVTPPEIALDLCESSLLPEL